MATQAFPTSRKMSRSDSTSASAPSSATRDYVEDYHKLYHCINYCSRSTHCIKSYSMLTDYAKYYCPFCYGTKYDPSSRDFCLFTFSFCFVWTDGRFWVNHCALFRLFRRMGISRVY